MGLGLDAEVGVEVEGLVDPFLGLWKYFLDFGWHVGSLLISQYQL